MDRYHAGASRWKRTYLRLQTFSTEARIVLRTDVPIDDDCSLQVGSSRSAAASPTRRKLASHVATAAWRGGSHVWLPGRRRLVACGLSRRRMSLHFCSSSPL